MVILLSLIFGVIQWVLSAWVLMITIGVIRAEWLHNVPTIGYGCSLLIAFFLTLLVNVFGIKAPDND